MRKDTLRTFSYAYGHTSKKPSINKHSINNTNICFSREAKSIWNERKWHIFIKHSIERKDLDQTRT